MAQSLNTGPGSLPPFPSALDGPFRSTGQIIYCLLAADDQTFYANTDYKHFVEWMKRKDNIFEWYALWLKFKLGHEHTEPTRKIWEYLNEAVETRRENVLATLGQYWTRDIPTKYFEPPSLRPKKWRMYETALKIYKSNIKHALAEVSNTRLTQKVWNEIKESFEQRCEVMQARKDGSAQERRDQQEASEKEKQQRDEERKNIQERKMKEQRLAELRAEEEKQRLQRIELDLQREEWERRERKLQEWKTKQKEEDRAEIELELREMRRMDKSRQNEDAEAKKRVGSHRANASVPKRRY